MDFTTSEITVYNEFYAQMQELKTLNESLVFDYEDPKQNKEARSHVAKLRKTKTAVETRRKEAKADALEYGRKLDSKAKELKDEIDSMIDVHAKPIAEIENREKRRIERVETFFDDMKEFKIKSGSSKYLEQVLEDVQQTKVDEETFLDRYDFAVFTLNDCISHLKTKIADTRKAEFDRAELEQLRKEKEQREAEELAKEQDRKNREAADLAKAREQERLIEEQKREIERMKRAEADRIEREKREAQEKADRERIAAELEAKRKAEEKIEEEKRNEIRKAIETQAYESLLESIKIHSKVEIGEENLDRIVKGVLLDISNRKIKFVSIAGKDLNFWKIR